MKKALITGLAGILLAGLSLSGQAQKREYIPGNVNGVEYKTTNEKNFSRYKLEEQCLFDNCYTFWNHFPKSNELNFSASKSEDKTYIFEIGKNVSIETQKYIPTKIGERIDVMNCLTMTRTSYDNLKKRAKSKEYFGFSVDITEKDLRFKLPEITVNGIPYIVLKAIENNNYADEKLPFYLIPKTKGTKIIIQNEPFQNGDYLAQARIVCDESGGIYQPILNNLNLQDRIEEETQEKWQGNTEETPYMRYTEEQEKKWESEMQETKKQKKAGEPCYYIVKSGDTGFWSIAGKTLGDEKRYVEIQDLNPDLKSRNLKIGQKILIPCK